MGMSAGGNSTGGNSAGRNPAGGHESGFTLIEVLISMGVGLVLMAAFVSTCVIQRACYDAQEQASEMVQNARAAMDMMTREIRMAGYFDPTLSALQRSDPDDPATAFVGIPYDPTQLKIVADFRGEHPDDPSDGDTDDGNEKIIYTYDGANLQIDRNTGGGRQPFAENIASFTFEYLDGDGMGTDTTGSIRQVRITIVARTAKQDPTTGKYRTYTLRSLVTPKNLAL